jgi:hypothetical protein
MKEKSPIWESTTAIDRRHGKRLPEKVRDREGRYRLADQEDGKREQDEPGFAQHMRRFEEHADRHEEQDRKGVPHRERVRGGAHAELGSADNHPGEERSECHRASEEQRRGDGDPKRECEDRQREQPARFGKGDLAKNPPDDAASSHDRESHQHQHEHGEDVLHNQPAHGDVAGRRVKIPVIGEDAHEHDGARHRQGNAEDQPRAPRPAVPVGHAGTQESRHGALHQGARHRDLPDGQQLVEVKLKPDAEHQQDCAHFRQLLGKMLVGHEPGV